MVKNNLRVYSRWTAECYDRFGNLKWAERDRPNVVTTEGINHMLGVTFSGVTQKTTWFVALFESDSTPAITDTYHAWADTLATECISYTQANRVEYAEAPAAAGVMTNSTGKAEFTFNATKTIYGAALVSSASKGTHIVGDYLFCVSKFASEHAVESDDILRVTVTITGSDS